MNSNELIEERLRPLCYAVSQNSICSDLNCEHCPLNNVTNFTKMIHIIKMCYLINKS